MFTALVSMANASSRHSIQTKSSRLMASTMNPMTNKSHMPLAPAGLFAHQMRYKSTATGATQAPTSDIFELQAQLDKQAEVIENIKQAKKDIMEKQSLGRQLALNVVSSNADLETHIETQKLDTSAQNEYFERQQRYQMFVDKMLQLYKIEKRMGKARKQAYSRMELAPVMSQKPIQTCLMEYSKLANKGFDCGVLAHSLKLLNQAVAAGGNDPLTFNDYTLSEMDTSWRMDKVTEDLRHGLSPNPNVFFSPYNLGRVSRELGELGYKNTGLMHLWFDKIDSMSREQTHKDYKEGAEVPIGQAMMGGPKNQLPRHYVYQGYRNSREFQQHVQTLLEYNKSKEESLASKARGGSEALEEVKMAALKLIDAAKEVKDMQQEMEAAIRNVRNQYKKLQSAHDEHTFLQQNQYVHLELLELQELLLKAGYLQPDEKVVNQNVTTGVLGMDAAVEVFYDLVLNYHPDALSPQYNTFYEAAISKSGAKKSNKAPQGDRHAQMTLQALSSTLIGLEKQALSFRRDIIDSDYPSEFYEKLMHPEEQAVQKHMEAKLLSPLRAKEWTRKFGQHVRMERTYLNAWNTFMERTQDLPERIEHILATKHQSAEDLYSALRALNACRFSAESVRQKIGEKFNKCDKSRKGDAQGLVDGIVGLAGCSYKPPNSKHMVKNIITKLQAKAPRQRIGQTYAPTMKMLDSLSFLQSVELLRGLSTPGMEKFQSQSYVATVKELCEKINDINYDILVNELKFDEFNQLHDAFMNLKFSSLKELRQIQLRSFQNETLRRAFEQRDVAEGQYIESHSGLYDPLKPRVIGGLSESLIKADLRDLHVIQSNETQGTMHKEMYPYSPDLLMGYEGQKVGIFVLNDDSVMRDTLKPCGYTQAKMSLVEQAHKLAEKKGTSVLKSVALPVRRVVDSNLQTQKLNLRPDFNISSFLKETKLQRKGNESRINTDSLSDFSFKLAKLAEKNHASTSAAFEEFMAQLLHVVRKRENIDAIFEPEQVLAAIDELKLQMLKLLMMHEANLTIFDKKLIENGLPRSNKNFEKFITEGLVKPLIINQSKIQEKAGDGPAQEERFWQGTRLQVEVPQQNSTLAPKSILPELLNQRFLWYDKYHHYADWKDKMTEAYDQFNLLELPSQSNKDQPSYYFLENQYKRRIPQGIFPDAKSPRLMLSPPGSELEVSGKEMNSLVDPLSRFERSPISTMLENELHKNRELANQEITSQIQAICNLQNIKHSLKSDVTDHKICDLLFNQLNITDKLIEAHLSGQNGAQGSANYVERDAEDYRRFLNEFGDSIVAPYDHFFMREAAKRGNPEVIAEQILALQQEHPPRPQEEFDAKMDELNRQLGECLYNYQRSNEDRFNLSESIPNRVEVTIDLDSLTPVTKRNDQGLSPVDLEMAPELFLKKQRCRAETNFIKARITYKVHSGFPLSHSEKRYLDMWIDKASETKTLIPHADVLVPSEPSKLSLAEALSPEDFYGLNSLSRVDINVDQSHEIALNDLILELSHFVDTETVRKVELGLLEEKLRQKWKLADDFSLVEKRNKEIDLVMHEIGEVSWRTAAMFDKSEKQYIEDIVFFDRGLDSFENAFLDMDKASFSNFFDEANCYDNRVLLLENWMCRKNEEIRQRVTLPTKQMAKSDQELYATFEGPKKQAREALVGEMLTTDEFGQDRVKKAYEELTTRELHLLAESLCVRLNLFQQRYPAFLPQVIKAIQEHRNTANSDRSMLNAYCKLFELDWRGDSSLDNREQFMFTNPVYMHEKDRSNMAAKDKITNESVIQQVRQACQPYLPNLITKMRQIGQEQKQEK